MAAWATAQKPRPAPRVVRLGRAANDNTRQPDLRVRLVVAGLAIAAVALAVLDGRLI
jgi:hypothetical protein